MAKKTARVAAPIVSKIETAQRLIQLFGSETAMVREFVIKHGYNRACAEIDSFRESFAKDSFHAISWGDGAMTAVAQQDVYQRILLCLDEGWSLTEIIKDVEKAAARAAEAEAQASSGISNIMNNKRRVALHRILNDLRCNQEAWVDAVAEIEVAAL